MTLNGKNSSYSYTVEDTKMEVKVQGLEEDLSSLSAAKMNIGSMYQAWDWASTRQRRGSSWGRV